MTRLMRCLIALPLAAGLLAGCVANPVTGEDELQFYDVQWEREQGEAMYLAMRQSQGGDYILDPNLTRYVQNIGQSLASKARRAEQLDFEFNILNDSSPNAWALPGGKIVINRGLLTELDSEAELAAVLGHEIVHADAAHTARNQSKGTLTQVGAIAAAILFGTQADSQAAQQAGVLLPQVGAQLLNQKYGRDAEREADYYGMQYMSEAGFDPDGAVHLQETFVRLAENRRQDWMSGLFASHPPSQERVALNRQTAQELPEGGRIGRDRYQQQIARLKADQPAYEAYDEAMKAAGEKNFSEANRLVDRAISIEPRESLFYALKGDLELVDDDQRGALRAYDRAVSLNPEMFYPRLRRGTLLHELDRYSDARTDLQASIELMPTAQAFYQLGNVERDTGNLQQARQYYSRAAQSNSAVGRAAQAELQKLGRRAG